jgi:isopentenyldiphosphate isomerase
MSNEINTHTSSSSITNDSTYEEVDAYDQEGKFVAVVPRWQTSHPEITKLYGQSAQVLFMREGRYAVAVRASTKKFWPGALDFTASGASKKGETVTDTVIREAKEELTIDLDINKLFGYKSWTPKDGYFSKGSVFIYIWDLPWLPSNTDDISEIRWVNLAALKRMGNDESTKMKPDFRTFLKHL